MSEEVQGEAVVEEQPQSTVLTEEEVIQTVNESETEGVEDTTLPSDVEEFHMPEKFQGKSAEDIAKAYMELEKLKQAKQEQEDDTTKEDESDSKEESKELSDEGEEKFKELFTKYDADGTLSEAEYKELEELLGEDRQSIEHNLQLTKNELDRQTKEILNGIDRDEYAKAAEIATKEWGEEKVNGYNQALASAPLEVQQILAKSLVDLFGPNKTEEVTLHTNQPQAVPSKGYKNRSELLADMADPRYETDKKFNKAVQDKLAISDDSDW